MADTKEIQAKEHAAQLTQQQATAKAAADLAQQQQQQLHRSIDSL